MLRFVVLFWANPPQSDDCNDLLSLASTQVVLPDYTLSTKDYTLSTKGAICIKTKIWSVIPGGPPSVIYTTNGKSSFGLNLSKEPIILLCVVDRHIL